MTTAEREELVRLRKENRILAEEREIYKQQARATGKPEPVIEKIVAGKMEKYYQEFCLLEQPFRDEERTVRDLVTEKIATIGENIRVRRFVRYALGEEM